MANSEKKSEGAAAPTVKVPILPLLVCVIVAAMLSVGGSAGVVWWMARAKKVQAAEATAGAAAKVEPALPTHAMAMEPMLVNLADADGRAYLRLGVVLQIEDPAKKEKKEETKGPSAADAQLRDVVLDVLGRQKSAELLEADGKDRLKRELKDRFVKAATEAKVHEVFFTDFLVQR